MKSFDWLTESFQGYGIFCSVFCRKFTFLA